MRKAIAAIFSLVCVIPLMTASLFLFGSRSWIMDSDLYRSTLGNVNLYQDWEGPAAVAVEELALDNDIRLDRAAVTAGLRAAYEPEEIARFVGEAAGGLVGRFRDAKFVDSFTIDLRPFKTEFDKRLESFAVAYAAAAPVGTAVTLLPTSTAQTAGTDLRFRPVNIAANVWGDDLRTLLSSGVAETPDSFTWPAAPTPRGLPAFLRDRSIIGLYDSAMISIAFLAAVMWFSSAMMAASLWRDRFLWLGSTLGFPAAILIISGAAMMIGGGSAGLVDQISGQFAAGIGAFGPAAQRASTILSPLFARIGQSFLVTGLIAVGATTALASARFIRRDENDDEIETV